MRSDIIWGKWNVYISQFSGLPMYVRSEDDPCDGARHKSDDCFICRNGCYNCAKRERAFAQAQYWGRMKYRLNIKPKRRFGEHEGRAYLYWQDYQSIWGLPT